MMTQDEIIRMAREAGFTDHEAFEGFECSSEELERFAAIVAAPLQAKIDALMLEYCPDEITPEQMDAWMKHQQPVQECRHCGWLCMPNHNPTKKAYVLQQADVDAAVLAEREACANVCEEEAEEWSGRTEPHEAVVRCTAAIRARK